MKNGTLLLTLLLALCMGSGLQAQSSLTNGLTSYYPFNGNANDVVGTNNGVATNVFLTTDRFGVANSAYLFGSQSNSAVYVPPTTVNNLTNGTITAWLELNSNTNGIVFSKQHDYVNTYAVLSVGAGPSPGDVPLSGAPGQVLFHPVNFNGAPEVGSSTFLSTGVWHHVAVTFSPSNCAVYINGILSTNAAGNFSVPNDTTANVTAIGAWVVTGTTEGFNGKIDDVRIYNRALSSNEVAQLYAVESVPPIVFIQNLTNFYAVYGQNTNISVTVTSTSPLSYQWYFVPANNSGQAGAYAETAGDFVYGAVVTNGGFGYGSIPHVSFTGGGGGGAAGYGMVSNGVLVGVTVTNAGSGYSSLPTVVIDPPNGILLGQTNSTLMINNASPNNLGNYDVVVSTSMSSVTSSVVNLTILYPATITENPAGFTNDYRTSECLSVQAAGTAPLTYQWFLNNTNIYGATNSSYCILSLDLTNAGVYIVEVVNPYGNMDSTPADVDVAPTLTSPFTGAVGIWGQDTTLDVGATGSGSLSYQWYFNGVAIQGASGSSYNFNDIQFTNSGLYSVVVSSAYGSVSNAAYEVVVNPASISLGTFPGVYINGTVGYNYTILSSTNLANTNAWVTITNITIPTSSYIWVDTSTDTSKPGNPMKFYSVIPGQ